MVLDYIQQQKKQKKMILIFGAVLLITAVVLWFGFFKKGKPFVKMVVEVPSKEININLELFESPEFKDLQPFEDISPFEGEIGRSNPFFPYYGARPIQPEI